MCEALDQKDGGDGGIGGNRGEGNRRDPLPGLIQGLR